MTPSPKAIADRLYLLRCPDCNGSLVVDIDDLNCTECRRHFPGTDQTGVSLLPQQISQTDARIQTFWADTYSQWYETDDASWTAESLLEQLTLLEDLFRRRNHLAVVEMDLETLSGQSVLEIGSGSGGHSALFRKYGAHMTSVDLTAPRVRSTGLKYQLLDSITPGSGIAIQADAGNLPFANNSFDIVYSNGVLHHAEDTQRCIGEVFRVLKPGGTAVIMLYARHSAFFWFNLWPRAVFSGRIFRMPEPKWLGALTEGRPTERSKRNPLTRVYSQKQLRFIFNDFSDVRFRRNSFLWSHFPSPYRTKIRNALFPLFGAKPHAGGRIIYGEPFIPETWSELFLSPLAGFCWNINAVKPSS